MAQSNINQKIELLMIGGSAGSLEVLMHLLPALRKDLSFAIIVILHRMPGESLLVQVLKDKTSWPVQEAEEKDTIQPRNIYVAPADYHLLIERDKTFSLDFSEKVHFSRPSIDVSFESAAKVFGASLSALLLSGANTDGAQGLLSIRNEGGLTIAQDPQEAAVHIMPQAAINIGGAEYILKTEAIAKLINEL
jgi:two-component system, chemotaxis family, protein-glutamate methylesterase/glutaminase